MWKDRPRYSEEYKERKDGRGDLTISVRGILSKVHRTVLMESSDYFKSMLSGGFSESCASMVDLSDSIDSVDNLNLVVDYMYTGEITLREENISSVVHTACLFLLSELQGACSEFLTTNICPKTCIPIFILAERYSLERVKRGCLEVIQAWFTFNLCHSLHALEMPADCLVVLVNENVFEFVPDDIKDNFMQVWYHHFKKNCGEEAPLPPELDLLIHSKGCTPVKVENAEKNNSDETQMEDVLLTVLSSKSGGIEIHAFAPKKKLWKKLLMMSDGSGEPVTEPVTIHKLIGVSQDKAFFLFRPCSSHSWKKDYLVTVDLVSNEETTIKLPSNVHMPTVIVYFLWGNDVCAFFSDDNVKWSLYVNKHESKCSEGSEDSWEDIGWDFCKGDCWEFACKLPKCSASISSQTFLTKEFQDDLYVWLMDDRMSYQPKNRFYCISKGQEDQCMVEKLPNPGRYEDFSSIDFDIYDLSYISVDFKQSLLNFTLKFDSGEMLVDFASFPQSSHEEYSYVYDVANKRWKKKGKRKVTYPEDVPRVLNVSRVLRNHQDMTVYREDHCLEACTFWYFTRSTSPYNTHIWTLEPDSSSHWQTVTIAPFHLPKVKYIKTCEMPLDYLKSLPNSEFEDYSEQIGHSAVTNMTAPNVDTDFEMEYSGELRDYEAYEAKWAEIWDERYQKTVSEG